MKSSYECYLCLKKKSLSEMKIDTVSGRNRGKCTSCHNDYMKNWDIGKKAKANPGNYLSCNDCDRTMNKYKKGKISEKKKRKEISECKFCKSTNIESYF